MQQHVFVGFVAVEGFVELDGYHLQNVLQEDLPDLRRGQAVRFHYSQHLLLPAQRLQLLQLAVQFLFGQNGGKLGLYAFLLALFLHLALHY